MTRDGSVERIGDKRVLRFQRRLEHPVERVWAAITERDPPRLFEIAGDPHGVLRFELEPDGDACWLTFTATVAAPDDVLPLALAGWHVHLDHLEKLLAGDPVDWERWDEQHRPAWERAHERYLAASVPERSG